MQKQEMAMETFFDRYLHTYFTRWLDEHKLAHAQVAVSTAFRRWSYPAGSLGSAPLSSDDAVFLIYSLTKTFIAVLILHLVSEDRINLENELTQYLQDIPEVPPVTIRQILSHRSGIPDYGTLATYHRDVKESPLKPWSEKEFLK